MGKDTNGHQATEKSRSLEPSGGLRLQHGSQEHAAQRPSIARTAAAAPYIPITAATLEPYSWIIWRQNLQYTHITNKYTTNTANRAKRGQIIGHNNPAASWISPHQPRPSDRASLGAPHQTRTGKPRDRKHNEENPHNRASHIPPRRPNQAPNKTNLYNA